MTKNWPFLFIGLVALILVGGVYVLSKGNSPSPSQLGNPAIHEYFWGEGCPHCANVAAFMETWEGKDKLELDKKEIYNNAANARLMTERYQKCNVIRSKMGVPLLVTPEGKCYSGDEPIINYFKSLNLGESSEPTASPSADES